MNKLRIFLADNHAVLREGLKLLVNAQVDMEVVGEAEDGRSACEKIVLLRPDIVVMDISMPELNGAQATAQVKQLCPEVKVLALTRYAEKGYLQQLLQAGATGYVLKRAGADELLHAIRSVATGGVYLDPLMAGGLVSTFVQKSPRDASQVNELSEREREVLRLTAWGYANKEIAAELNISVKTVETHKAHVMEKLNLHSRTELVRYALRQGWLRDG